MVESGKYMEGVGGWGLGRMISFFEEYYDG